MGASACLFLCFVQAQDQPIWKEIGLQSTETKGQITTWKFQDSTAALAGLGEVLATTPDRVERIGNYVVACHGKCPKDLAQFAPGHRDKAIAPFYSYLPIATRVPRSERYILGSQGLQRNLPQVAEPSAAFQFSTEAAAARYRTPQGERTVAIFSYITPALARQHFPEFQKIPNATAKRSGPMIAVVFDADEISAARLLKDVEYQAAGTWDEQPPLVILPLTAVQIVLAGLKLAGVIILFCFFSGLAYAAFRLIRQSFGYKTADDSVLVLGLSDK